MTAGYTLTETAEAELVELLTFVAERDGTARALHVHSKFVEAFEHLAHAPGTGAKRPALTGERVRWWTVFRWIVIYEHEDSPITILRVLHGARDLDRLFGSEH